MNPLQFLPKELEDIIIDYKNGLEHQEKYKKCMNELSKINNHQLKNYTQYLHLREIDIRTYKKFAKAIDNNNNTRGMRYGCYSRNNGVCLISRYWKDSFKHFKWI